MDLLNERIKDNINLQQVIRRKKNFRMRYWTVKVDSHESSGHHSDMSDGRSSDEKGLTCRSPAPDIDNSSKNRFKEQTA